MKCYVNKICVQLQILVYNWCFADHKPQKEMHNSFLPDFQEWFQLLGYPKKFTLWSHMPFLDPSYLIKVITSITGITAVSQWYHYQHFVDTGILTIYIKKRNVLSFWTRFLTRFQRVTSIITHTAKSTLISVI